MENTLKIIETIGRQWPFLLVIFVIIIFIIKWNTIWAFIGGITNIKVKRGETELEIAKEEKTEKEELPKLDSQKTESIETTSVNKENKEQEDESVKYRKLLEDRKFSEAKTAYEKILEKEPSEQKRKERSISNFYLRHIYGDVKAFDEFEEYVTKVEGNNELKSEINSTLSLFHKDSGDFKKAVQLLKDAIELTSEEENKAYLVSRISDLHFENDEKQKSIEILIEYLPLLNSRKPKYILYRSIAQYYEKEKNKLLESLAYHKALECQPNDISLIFSAAYNYSQVEDKFKDIGYLLYKKLLFINPKHESALNNLGVSYKNLEMPFKSVQYYKKALEVKSTIAASNLAYLLMDGGFENEAEEYLKNAQQNDNIHDNVFSAASNLKTRLNNEKEKEDKVKIKAEKKYRFLSSYGEAIFSFEKIKIDDSTKWKYSTYEVKIETENNKVIISWENGEERHSMTGIRINNSFELIYSKPKRKYYSLQIDDKYEFIKHEGYGFIDNKDSIQCMFEIEKELVDYNFTK